MVIKKLTFMVVSIYLFFLLVGAAASDKKSIERPNIIIFFKDNNGFDDLACYCAKDFHTPNLALWQNRKPDLQILTWQFLDKIINTIPKYYLAKM